MNFYADDAPTARELAREAADEATADVMHVCTYEYFADDDSDAEHCTVCGRHFDEVHGDPLAEHWEALRQAIVAGEVA